MNGPTSCAPPNPRTILRELPAFLRRPRVLAPAGLARAQNWQALGMLYVLHVAVLLLLTLPVSALVQKLLGLSPPDAFGKVPRDWLLPITVLIAPMLEEMLFRGWQSGRPRALWLLGCGLAGIGLLLGAAHALGPLWTSGCLLSLALIAAAGWFALRERRAAAVFVRAYPLIFWVVALGFGAVHVMNYANPSALTGLLVLPQLWAGVMLGFTRQRIGLGASMLQHAGANAAVMALSLAAGF